MSSIALKFTSLAIRTLSKPIGNYIKRQAREHPGFRQTCINFAQAVHRIDMRWRIGLLQDAQALERQARKDASREAAKKSKPTAPTVPTEAEAKAAEEASLKAADEAAQTEKQRPQPKIRPLSEAKAIETGANFISETFLFGVAAGLILFETWRSRRKESGRREDVKERLDDLEESEKAARRALIELEREVLELRANNNNNGNNTTNSDAGTTKTTTTTSTISQQKRILPREVYDPPSPRDNDQADQMNRSWFASIAAYLRSTDTSGNNDDQNAQDMLDNRSPGPAEQILVESDKALEEKHKQQAIAAEHAAQVAQAAQATSNSTTTVSGKSGT